MNRKERRAAGKGSVSRQPKMTPEQVCAKLKNARPTEVLCPVLGRNAKGKAEMRMKHDTTDWSWLADVESEGFDWHGPLGPTYYRRIPTHYCSTFFHPQAGQPALLMSLLRGARRRPTAALG